MYYVYLKEETGFDSKKLIGEFREIDNAYAKIEAELAKDKNFKYVLEKTTGHVDNYGNLTEEVVDEN